MTETIIPLRSIFIHVRNIEREITDDYVRFIVNLKTTQSFKEFNIDVLEQLFIKPGEMISDTLVAKGWISSDPNEVKDVKEIIEWQNDPSDYHLTVYFTFLRPSSEAALL